ncbi:MAG: acyl carrier protein [Petrimonas sp.]|jgi:acyl carrier protein
MKKKRLFTEIKQLIIQSSGAHINNNDIQLETRLIEDLHFESIALIELVINLEDHFEIQFNSETILKDNLNSVTNLMEQIDFLLEQKNEG